MKKVVNIHYTQRTRSLFLYEDLIENFNPNYFIEKIDKNISEELSYNTNAKNQITDWHTFVDDIELRKIFLSFDIFFNDYLKTGPLRLDDCWGTKSCEFVETIRHDHSLGVSGIIYLTEGGPGTFFPQFNFNVSEKIGKIVFFDSQTEHEVKKTKINNTRYLLAFNFKHIKPWNLKIYDEQ